MQRLRIFAVLSALAACVFICAVVRAEPATMPAATPTTMPASRPATTTAPATRPSTSPATTQPAFQPFQDTVTKLIAAIRNSKDVRAAAESYARARTMDRNNVKIYEAYMKKMLKLGQPRIASYAAAELTRRADDNGTAWGVVGYCHAKRGMYFTAVGETLRALALAPTDAAIQQNAGYLLAWYDHASDLPELPLRIRRLLRKHREDWEQQREFSKAYREVASDLKSLSKKVKDLEGKASDQRKQFTELRDKRRDNDRELADLKKNIRDQKRRISSLQFRIQREEDEDEKRRLRDEQQSYRKSIDLDQRRFREVERQNESLFRKLDREQAVLKKLTKDLDRARKELKTQREKGVLDLDWLPPAVDGVITPEDEAPLKTIEAAQPGDNESKAQALLKLAKVLLDNDLKAKAAQRLREAVRLYPDTKAAKDARLLIEKHKLIEKK